MIVYCLIDPRNDRIRYIGKTERTARRRLRRHLADCYLRGDSHKERWIRQLIGLGLEPGIEILQRCNSASELCKAEVSWISFGRRIGMDLTNLTDGGETGASGYRHTPESKEKIRAALTGKAKTAEHARRIGKASRGRKITEETRQRLRDSHKGPRKPLAESHRLGISRGRGVRPFVDQNGNVYQMQIEAADKLGISQAHISRVLNGTRSHAGGHVFKYLSQMPIGPVAKPEPTVAKGALF